MKLNDFISKYDGRHIDFDGHFGCQCVDMARFYFEEVCGARAQPAGVAGARDFYFNYGRDPVLQNYFVKIPNTPELIPLPGDVVIWDRAKNNPYGHIAVFIDGGVLSFDSFDQNLPTGAACHTVRHTYANVLGFLRPKNAVA